MKNLLEKLKRLLAQPKGVQPITTQTEQESHIDRMIRDLQRKGLFLPNVTKETFEKVLPEMQAIGCSSSFIFSSVAPGTLTLFVFGNDLTSVEVTGDPMAQVPASAVPLNQLQEVAGWLNNHGMHAAQPLLGREAIEKKLEGLMKSCPHGAYVLHAPDKVLTLSRLSPKGQIEHIFINLQKQLGLYTLELDGSEISATRVQFRRRLEQMGTPVRLKARS
jgi:hypothetical protein